MLKFYSIVFVSLYRTPSVHA